MNPTVHQFSPSIARTHGLEAAILYQHIRWVCARQRKYEITKKELLEVFPYLSRKRIITALGQLLDNHQSFEARLLLRTSEDTNPTYRLAVRVQTRKFHYFDPQMAERFGLAAAILYDDLVKWIVKNDFGDDEPYHYESADTWARSHPYISVRSIERAFSQLKQAGELVFCGRIKGRMPVWTIPLGQGKLDRWKEIRTKKPTKKVNKTVVQRPSLPDLDFPSELCTVSSDTSQKVHRQKGTPHRQKGTPHRQKGTPHRQKGTPKRT